MRIVIGSLTLALIGCSSVANAQTDSYGTPVAIAATSLEELRPLLKVGTSVLVVDASGTKVRGRLVSLQPPSFGTLAKHPLLLPDQPLRAWWVDDSVLNGVKWGFLTGFGGGALFVEPACAGAIEGNDSLLACTVLGSLVVGAGGALAGLLVDALIHDKELRVDYRPPQKRSATVTLLPRHGGGGAAVAFRF
jgi:hypothetical protein